VLAFVQILNCQWLSNLSVIVSQSVKVS